MEMNNGQELPKRKKNRLENYDYSSCGAYFITICTSERKNYFWKNVGAIIDRPQNVAFCNTKVTLADRSKISPEDAIAYSKSYLKLD